MRRSNLFILASLAACGLAVSVGCSDNSENVYYAGGSGNEANGGEGGAEQGGSGGAQAGAGGAQAGAGGAQAGAGGAQAGAGGAQAGAGGAQAGAGGAQAGAGGAQAGAGGAQAGSGGTGGSSGQIVNCTGTPTTCANIGSNNDAQYYGCCAGDTVYWCDDQTGKWELHSVNCASSGDKCTYDKQFESMYCVAAPCTDTSCPSGQVCVNGVCTQPPCTPTSCPSGQVCINQVCINDPGPGPGPGPGPTCNNLPPVQCTGTAAFCGELVPFDPDNNPAATDYNAALGYIDYPANGETWTNQYRSFIRRDLMMLIKYATAFVACKAAGWTSGNGKPLGLIDMSEANGAIPGTSVGQPGHPSGTHTNGFDIDVAYYQNGTADNKAREVCAHTTNGQEQYHCTATPHLLDTWRNALFVAALHNHPYLRVIGCDGKVGPMVVPAINKLCADGWINNGACKSSTLRLTYEETDQGYGWFLFHHHHMHISFNKPSYPSYPGQTAPSSKQCLIPSCDAAALKSYYDKFGAGSN